MGWVYFWSFCLIGNLVMWWSVGHWFNIFASGIAISALGDALLR